MGLRNTSREDIYHWRTLHIVNVVTHPLPVKIFVFSECDVMSLYGEHILIFQLSAIVASSTDSNVALLGEVSREANALG